MNLILIIKNMETINIDIFENILFNYLLVKDIFTLTKVNYIIRRIINNSIKKYIPIYNMLLAHINLLFDLSERNERMIFSHNGMLNKKIILYANDDNRRDIIRCTYNTFTLYEGIEHKKEKILCKKINDLHINKKIMKFMLLTYKNFIYYNCNINSYVKYICSYNRFDSSLFEYQDYFCIFKSKYIEISLCIGASNNLFNNIEFAFRDNYICYDFLVINDEQINILLEKNITKKDIINKVFKFYINDDIDVYYDEKSYITSNNKEEIIKNIDEHMNEEMYIMTRNGKVSILSDILYYMINNK